MTWWPRSRRCIGRCWADHVVPEQGTLRNPAMILPRLKHAREYSLSRFGGDLAGGLIAALIGLPYGLALMMVISQLRVMLALQPPAGGWNETMLGQFCQVAVSITKAQPIPVLLAFIVIAMATGAGLLLPKGPAPLIGVFVAIAVGKLFGWHE